MKRCHRHRDKCRKAEWLLLLGLWLPALLSIGMLLFLLGASFMDATELQTLWRRGFSDFHILPRNFSLQNWETVLLRSPECLLYFWNSVIISLPAVLGAMAVSSAAGYGLAHMRFRGKQAVLLLLILLMMMPYQVTLTPNFLVLKHMGLLDSPLAVILPIVFHPLAIVTATSFMRSVPQETLDAARIDGAGQWQCFLHIALGQTKGGLSILMLYLFLDSWSIVEPVIALMRDQTAHPLSVALSSFSEMLPGIRAAAGILYVLPALLLFGAVREQLLQGLTKTERHRQ